MELDFQAAFTEVNGPHNSDSGKQTLDFRERGGRLQKRPITHSKLLNAHGRTMSPINLKPWQEVQGNNLQKIPMSAYLCSKLFREGQ